MQGIIGSRLVAKLAPQAKPYEVWDTRLPGSIVRVQPSGVKSYIVHYDRGKRLTLGRVGVLKPAQARDRAKKALADHVQGVDPREEKRARKAHTLASFLEDEYSPWAEAHLTHGAATLARIRVVFGDLLGKKLPDVTGWAVEKWRASALRSGRKATGVNRDLDALRAALSKAVEWKRLAAHPLALVKRSKVDETERVRYLNADEETRLRTVLLAREERIRAERDSANAWRREREYPLLPDLRAVAFADGLQPMALVTMNTGLRRGELFGLEWSAVNLDRRLLTVTARTAKTKRSRHVPLNDEGLGVLKAWREQSFGGDLVFPGRNGERRDNVRKAWDGVLDDAKIENFTWHDLRHHFASRLVQEGVDLNVVRELLGHTSLKMTIRYAHLAPEHRAAAVAKITPRFSPTADGKAANA